MAIQMRTVCNGCGYMRPIDGVAAVLKSGRGIAGLAVLCAAAAILAYLFVRPSAPAVPAMPVVPAMPTVPDFAAIADVRERKAAFFAFLVGPVEDENAGIRAQRRELLAIRRNILADTLDTAARCQLAALAAEYRVPSEGPPLATTTQLLRRIDVVPVDLALVQAAIESGWGRSRFALLGNNLFGTRCFRPGCGFVPAHRPAGEVYEVRRFRSIEEAVAVYMHNLNTHAGYVEFRRLRAALRDDRMRATGAALADTLGIYSTRGQDYLDQVVSMIGQYHALADPSGPPGDRAPTGTGPRDTET